MNDAVAAPTVTRLTRLPDTFWQAVMAAPWRYDLFQLLRRLDAQGGAPYPLGRAPLPRFDAIRLGQRPTLTFAPSTLAAVSLRRGGRYDIEIFSFGLFGPGGPLPLHLTEYVRERMQHHQDQTLRAFADLFHHRLTLLFYRAWADAQPTVSLDRADNRRFNRYLAALIGMGQPGQLAKGCLSDHARFAFASHLIRHGRDPQGLTRILSAWFAVPVALIANVPQWMPLSADDQVRLGAGRRWPRLGENAFLGVAVRDVQHKFRLDIGPLDRQQYRAFLPDQPQVAELCDWVRQYVGIDYAWEVRLILDAAAVDGVTLEPGARLGYDSWLGLQPQPHPRGDLIFRVERQ